MNEEIKQKIEITLKKIISYMDLESRVEFREDIDDLNNTTIVAAVYVPENAKFLIGKNGQNIKALEHIARAVLADLEEGKNLTIDVNDYKKIRANHIIEIAKQAVTRVRSTQREETLLPMSAYERRIIHMELASYPDVTTESIGQDPQRRIIVKLCP